MDTKREDYNYRLESFPKLVMHHLQLVHRFMNNILTHIDAADRHRLATVKIVPEHGREEIYLGEIIGGGFRIGEGDLDAIHHSIWEVLKEARSLYDLM